MKFKVGDKVRLVGDANSTSGKRIYFGEIKSIESFTPNSKYPYRVGCGYLWRDSELELVEPVKKDKIVIIHDCETTTATLYRANGSKVKATAKCSPEDTFDFNVGAKLAMERLMEKVEQPEVHKPPKPEYYNGKVVCVDNFLAGKDAHFTLGKVYEVVNGKFTDDNGWTRPNTEDRVVKLNEGYFADWCYKFIPYVE